MASRRPDLLGAVDRALAPLTWLAAAFVVVVLFAGPELIGAHKPAAAAAGAATSGAPASGEAVFASAGCGGCHTLSAAGSSGSTGPNLDDVAPDAATVEAVVRSGSGVMPSFQGRLSDAEIQAVARYVADSAGGP
jgi:mono/diheme cytochrome c family protein